nr:zinc finger, CCHC-type [Tanacetum cinerariifolium]
MHFLFFSVSVVYMLTTPIPDDGDDATVDQLRRRAKMHDSDKQNSNNVAGLSVVNMVEHNNSSRYNDNKDKRNPHDNTKADPNKKSKVTCWKWGKPGHLKKGYKGGKGGNKANGSSTNDLVDSSTNSLKGERGIECIFVGYVEHSKAFRFYVNEPNDSVSINFIIESRDDIFDENRFLSVPGPSLRIPNETKDIGGSVVPEEVTEEVIQQPNLSLEKDDPNIFDEAMKSRDVAFWKEAINDEMDSIMGNNTWVLADLPPYYFDTYALVAHISIIRLLIAMASMHNLIIHQMDVKKAFLNDDLEEEVYMNQPQGFIMPGNKNKVCKLIKSLYELKHAPKQWHQKFDEVVLSNSYLLNEADKCYIVNLMKLVKESSFVYMYTMNYRLTYSGYPSVLEGYTNASWISNTEDNSSTIGWVFLLGGGVIFWAFKKQTCITGSTIKLEFVALATAGKESEWLKNLLLEISLWPKPIVHISIRCDSAATLAKTYRQMYNEKSRHLGVRHNMIPELITNRLISIKFVRSQ